MKKVRVSFKYRGKKFNIDTFNCQGLELGLGLMFRRKEKAPILLFELPKRSNMALTSLFVFFKFMAVWIDDKNNVVDVQIVNPFRFIINSKRPFTRVIEIPLSKRYTSKAELLVGKERFKKINC